jgi:hypothetical protein
MGLIAPASKAKLKQVYFRQWCLPLFHFAFRAVLTHE